MYLDSPMGTGRATGWWDRRADRDSTLLLVLRGEVGFAAGSSLLEGGHRPHRQVTHTQDPGASPGPCSVSSQGGLSTVPRGSAQDRTPHTGPGPSAWAAG